MGGVILANRAAAVRRPVTGMLIKNIAEGSLVNLMESGSPVEFYVAKHDYEPSLNGGGRTLLVRKDLCRKGNWGSGENRYAGNTMDVYLNGPYRATLDEAVLAAAGTTAFYYISLGNGDGAVNVLERTVFVLSGAELGSSTLTDGAALPIHELLRESAKYEGSSTTWWTRTPYAEDDEKVLYVSTSGGMAYLGLTGSRGYRPCLTLPGTAVFNETTMLFEEVI